MPYIDTFSWFDVKLVPEPGETYSQFRDRCLTAMLQLKPDLPEEDAQRLVESAWSDFILRSAVEATITIKREMITDTVYQEFYFTDWQVDEIHSATVPGITYSSIDKQKDHFQIAKAVEDKQLVFGWANIAKEADGSYPLDWDGDVTEPEELEKAAYSFVLKYRAAGEMHEGETIGHLVESVMFTKEKQQALGIPEGILPEGWWVGFYIPDKEVFAKIKSGEYEMWSVQGKAKRVPTGQ